jgi:hypothetical protein
MSDRSLEERIRLRILMELEGFDGADDMADTWRPTSYAHRVVDGRYMDVLEPSDSPYDQERDGLFWAKDVARIAALEAEDSEPTGWTALEPIRDSRSARD